MRGILELHPRGFGFLRTPEEPFIRQLTDPFVSKNTVDQYRLREGVMIIGMVEFDHENRGPRLVEMISVEGFPPNDYAKLKPFDQLVSTAPNKRLFLETGPTPVTPRITDIFLPLAKGFRLLTVVPPHTGKNSIIEHLTRAITINYPEIHVLAFFVNESDEKILDFKRLVQCEVVPRCRGDLGNLIRIAQLVFERCQRLVETGKDVFFLVDSITDLARAVNSWKGKWGETSLDVSAMENLKKGLSMASQIKDGGSLTIVGTLNAGDKDSLDEAIYREFQGTVNSKLVLDQELADYAVIPPLDVFRTGTRFEEILFTVQELKAVNILRQKFRNMDRVLAMELLIQELLECESNAEFYQRYGRKLDKRLSES